MRRANGHPAVEPGSDGYGSPGRQQMMIALAEQLAAQQARRN